MRVTNDTEYLSLCVCCSIILSSDHKLYRIETLSTERSNPDYVLSELTIITGENYSNKFAVINSECYKFFSRCLFKIPIIAKKYLNPVHVVFIIMIVQTTN